MSDRKQLIRELEAQGFTWRETTKGHVLVYSPDGRVVTTLSGSTSDHRSLKNAIAALRRAGFTWKGR
ncbi:MAG: hypothetical protein ABWZ52_13835 [Acidimicrobiales bacterium]